MKKLLLNSCLSICLLLTSSNLYGSRIRPALSGGAASAAAPEVHCYEISELLPDLTAFPLHDTFSCSIKVQERHKKKQKEKQSEPVFKALLRVKTKTKSVASSFNISCGLPLNYVEANRESFNDLTVGPNGLGFWTSISDRIPSMGRYDEVDELLDDILLPENTSEQSNECFQKFHNYAKNLDSFAHHKLSQEIPEKDEIVSCMFWPEQEEYAAPESSRKVNESDLLLKLRVNCEYVQPNALSEPNPFIPEEVRALVFNPNKTISLMLFVPKTLWTSGKTNKKIIFDKLYGVLYYMHLRETAYRDAILSWTALRIYSLTQLMRLEPKLREKLNSENQKLLDAYLHLPEAELVRSGKLIPYQDIPEKPLSMISPASSTGEAPPTIPTSSEAGEPDAEYTELKILIISYLARIEELEKEIGESKKENEQLKSLNSDLLKRMKTAQSVSETGFGKEEEKKEETEKTEKTDESEKDNNMAIFLQNMERLQEAFNTLESQKTSLENELKRLAEENQKSAAENNRLVEENRRLDGQLKALQARLKKLETQLSSIREEHKAELEEQKQRHKASLQTSQADLQKQIKEKDQQLQQRTTELQKEQEAHQKTKENETRLREQNQKLKKQREKLQLLQPENDKLKQQLQDIQKQLRISEEKSKEDLAEQQAASEKQIIELQTEFKKRMAEQQSEFEKQFAELTAESEKRIAELAANFEHAQKEKEELTAVLSEKDRTITESQARADELARAREADQQAIAEKDEIIADLQAEIERLRAELERIQSAQQPPMEDDISSLSSESIIPNVPPYARSVSPWVESWGGGMSIPRSELTNHRTTKWLANDQN